MIRLLLLVIFISFFCKAQEQVSGTVVNMSSKKPLEDVVVMLKGKSRVIAVTDLQGKYMTTIKISKSDTLIFQLIGYKTAIVKANQPILNIELEKTLFSLDDVVFKKKRSNINDTELRKRTGSIVEINALELQNMPNSNLLHILQGKVTGLKIEKSGELGTDPKVRIRGTSSLKKGNKANEPLYVIDGQIVPAGTFYTLNVEDIKKVKILKDAAANALYGIKAANGVIEITLKKGYNGPVQISVNYQTGITLKGSQQYEMMNSADKLEYERLSRNMNLPGYIYSKDYIDVKYSGNPSLHKQKLSEGNRILDSLKQIKTNWYDLLVRRSMYHKYNVSARGGDQTKSFYLSAGYHSQGGKIEGNDKNSLSLYGNYGYSVNEDIHLGFNSNISYTKFTNKSPENNLNNPRQATISHVQDLYNSSDLVYKLNSYETPESRKLPSLRNRSFKSILNKFDKNDTHKQFSFSGILNYQILEGLRLDASNGVAFNFRNKTDRLAPDHPSQAWIKEADGIDRNSDDAKKKYGKHTELYSERIIYTSNIRINYSKNITDVHHITVGGNIDYSYEFDKSTTIEGHGIISKIRTLTSINQNLEKAYKTVFESHLKRKADIGLGFVSGYNYNDTFDLYGFYKADASSLLPQDKRWNTAWVAGTGWEFARHSFVSELLKLSSLKLSANYGQTANISAVDAAYTTPIFSYAKETSYNQGRNLSRNSLNNRFLKAEQVKSVNIALNIGWMDNRFNLRAEVYRRKTIDAIIDVKIQPSNGFYNIKRNVGILQNEGVELSLNAGIIRGIDFSWDASFNISYNKNIVLDLYDGDELYSSDHLIADYKVGRSVDELYGLKSLGVNAITGYESYETPDGRILTGDSKLQLRKGDFHRLGYSSAPITGGFSHSFSYMNFTLGLDFYYEIGNKKRIFPYHIFDKNLARQNKPKNTLKLVWLKSGDYDRKIPSPFTYHEGLLYANDKNIADASFIRLSNLHLTYDASKFAKKFTSNILSYLYASIQTGNLFTYSPFTGEDPEGGTLRTAAQKIITIKVNMRF